MFTNLEELAFDMWQHFKVLLNLCFYIPCFIHSTIHCHRFSNNYVLLNWLFCCTI